MGLVRTAPPAEPGGTARPERALDSSGEAARRLREAGVPEPEASAEVLLSELLGGRRSELALRGGLTDEQRALYDARISRRLDREPVQRILGYAYFRNLKLKLSPDTLVPRPDTESVVEAALQAVDRRGGACRVLDVGTGSGAIAIAIAQERPRCEVHATDISRGALETARHNAKENVAEVRFYEADLFPNHGELDGIEVLVSNPPYIESRGIEALAPEVCDSDPRGALDGGPDGLRFYRRIFAEAMPFLVVGADVILEVGDGQAEAVLEIGRHAGFEPRGTHADLTGTPRATLLRWPG